MFIRNMNTCDFGKTKSFGYKISSYIISKGVNPIGMESNKEPVRYIFIDNEELRSIEKKIPLFLKVFNK